MAENWPTDTFTDLAALAAKGDGSLIRVKGMGVDAWTYVGAPLGSNSGNSLRLPAEYVSGRRVWGAIVRQLWKPIAAENAAALNSTTFGQSDSTKFFVGDGASKADRWATDPTYLPNDQSGTFDQVVPVADARAKQVPRTLASAGTVSIR